MKLHITFYVTALHSILSLIPDEKIHEEVKQLTDDMFHLYKNQFHPVVDNFYFMVYNEENYIKILNSFNILLNDIERIIFGIKNGLRENIDDKMRVINECFELMDLKLEEYFLTKENKNNKENRDIVRFSDKRFYSSEENLKKVNKFEKCLILCIQNMIDSKSSINEKNIKEVIKNVGYVKKIEMAIYYDKIDPITSSTGTTCGKRTFYDEHKINKLIKLFSY